MIEFDETIEEKALEGQTRHEPNPELAHQHDEDRDPLDMAIVEENQLVEENAADLDDDAARDELVELVRQRVKAEEQTA